MNTHELELRYLNDITIIKNFGESKAWISKLAVKMAKKRLKKRLERLSESYVDGHISTEVFNIWKQMINEVL